MYKRTENKTFSHETNRGFRLLWTYATYYFMIFFIEGSSIDALRRSIEPVCEFNIRYDSFLI